MNASPATDVQDYLRPLRRRWWLIALVVLAAAGFTYARFADQPKRYISGTTVFLDTASSTSGLLGQAPSYIDPERVTRNQARLLSSRPVAVQVARRIGFGGDPAALQGAVSVQPSPDSDFVTIAATTTDPRQAAQIANAYAEAFIDLRAGSTQEDLDAARARIRDRLSDLPVGDATRAQRRALQAQLRQIAVAETLATAGAEQVERAQVPTASIGPYPRRNAAFAGALALVFALGLAYGLELLDKRLRRVDVVDEAYGVPVLAVVPRVKLKKPDRERLAVPDGLREVFRTLRTTLQLRMTADAAGAPERRRVLVVSSALSGEGKTTVVRNLGLAFFESGLRVAVVDADMRERGLSRTFGLGDAEGLADVLTGERGVEDVLRSVEPEIEVRDALRARGVREDAAPAAHPPVAAAVQTLDPPLAAGTTAHSPSGFHILPAGRPTTDPASLLVGGSMRDLLHELAQQHDVVLVDSPPLLAVSDTAPLLLAADGSVLVARLGVVDERSTERVRELLARTPADSVLGVVANDARDKQASYYGYGYGKG
jgi:Mrp family chromosome partitioning ATPase/capsular polysaccharide biosynthesis protein